MMWLRDLLKRRDSGAAKAAPRKVASAMVDRDAIWLYVRCNRCHEKIALRLRKSDEIQRNHGEGGAGVFFVHKVAIGTQCFNRMDLHVEFGTDYSVTRHDLTGGTLLSAEDYAG
ncbi:MAG: hypothetical protein HYY08_02595 [Firmicutes bacterium]|nr:hypothetical protein [Bacillota bacterium]